VAAAKGFLSGPVTNPEITPGLFCAYVKACNNKIVIKKVNLFMAIVLYTLINGCVKICIYSMHYLLKNDKG
jgi:hypothetical protein